MNTKISMPELAAILALRTSLSSEECEMFLRQFAASVSGALEAGESVKIKDFGTFKLTAVEPRRSISVVNGDEMEIPAHNRVSFIASKELALEINAPFEAFEAVEIPDDIDENAGNIVEDESDDILSDEVASVDMMDLGDETDSRYNLRENDIETDEESVVDSMMSAQKAIEDSDYIFDSSEEKISPSDNTEQAESSTLDEVVEDAYNSGDDVSDAAEIEDCQSRMDENAHVEDRYSQDKEAEESGRKQGNSRSFLKGFLLGILTTIIIMVCAVVLFAVINNSGFGLDKNGSEITAVKDDTREGHSHDAVAKLPENGVQQPQVLADSSKETKVEVPTSASDVEQEETPVYDRISTTRYLTTMAKEHYGNYHLWPYIYEENKAILGHPDRIRPGTRVRIPSLNKYGVDAKDPAAIAKAKKMGVAIYARYK